MHPKLKDEMEAFEQAVIDEKADGDPK